MWNCRSICGSLRRSRGIIVLYSSCVFRARSPCSGPAAACTGGPSPGRGSSSQAVMAPERVRGQGREPLQPLEPPQAARACAGKPPSEEGVRPEAKTNPSPRKPSRSAGVSGTGAGAGSWLRLSRRRRRRSLLHHGRFHILRHFKLIKEIIVRSPRKSQRTRRCHGYSPRSRLRR